MAVSTKKAPARRVAKKNAKTAAATEAAKVLSEGRLKARERNLESRNRAAAETGVKATAPRIEIYRLKNRKTGEVRVLIDARGDGSVAEKPWIVKSEASGVEIGYATRKELGANYSKVDLSGGTASSKRSKGRRVAKG